MRLFFTVLIVVVGLLVLGWIERRIPLGHGDPFSGSTKQRATVGESPAVQRMMRRSRIGADIWLALWVGIFVVLTVRLGGWGLVLWAIDWILLTISWYGDGIAPHAARLSANPTPVGLLRACGIPGIILFLVGIFLFPLFSLPIGGNLFLDIPAGIIFWFGHGWIVGRSSNLAGARLLGRLIV